MDIVSENFLVNLSQSIGISYDLKKNVLGSATEPNSALFSALQISSILLYGKPIFAVYESSTSFSTISFNSTAKTFQFSVGKVFFQTNLISVPSQTIPANDSTDTSGKKRFKFYLDYNDFDLASTIFSANITSVDTNTIVVDQLPSVSYLNNFKQVNLNGYLIAVQYIDSSNNTVYLNTDVSGFTFVGDSVNFIFQPVIKYITTFATSGAPPDINIPSSGIILASAILDIDASLNYTLSGAISTDFVAYPVYNNPASFFPSQQAYNAFVTSVNNSLKSYNSVQTYDIESSLVNSYVNYTSGISTSKQTFDQYWHIQPYKPTGFFQYGIGYQGLQKIDFDPRFKDFWFFNKGSDLTRTLAIFRGDIYGGNAYVGQTLGQFSGSVGLSNYKDLASVSTLNNGTYSYGVSAVVPSGEYNPVFKSTSNFFFNSRVLNYISWTSATISNLLFFHVYRHEKTNNGFQEQRLTSPFQATKYTLNDTILANTTTAQGIGSSNFAFKIKASDSTEGIIGGVYFNAYLPDSTPLTGIQSCVILSSGQNYISPVVNINGTGTGASISITTNSTGGISSALITSFGSGYTELPTLTIFDTVTNSGGSGAILLPYLSTLNLGIYTGVSTSPTNLAYTLASIPIASISSTKMPINIPVVNSNFVGLNSNTNYWAVFSMHTPYTLTNNQKLQFVKNTGYITNFASSHNGNSWSTGISSVQIAKLGFLDGGSTGTVINSRGTLLTNEQCATPERLQIYIPYLDISSLTFKDIGYNAGIGTTSNVPIQNSMNVYVVAQNTATGIQSTLFGQIPRGTSRGSSILLGGASDLFDTVVDIFVEPNLTLGVNFIPNTTIINWTIYDLFTIDSKP